VTTYVLVHGAWGGAHGWRKVRPLLQRAGHEVFTPSLTGLGERAHLTSPQVTLTTHVQDIVNCIEYEDLRPIVLLGYSYGGMVVTGAIDYVEERVSHLVYLDAFLPDDGQSLYGMTHEQPRALPGQDWLAPPPAREYDDPEEAAWANPRRNLSRGAASRSRCDCCARLRSARLDVPTSRPAVRPGRPKAVPSGGPLTARVITRPGTTAK
jgi:pimeloyl-ACP methyl ester carboxylesterase